MFCEKNLFFRTQLFTLSLLKLTIPVIIITIIINIIIQEVESSACSYIGTYECGLCSCDETSYGDQCQCDKPAINVGLDELNAPCIW